MRIEPIRSHAEAAQAPQPQGKSFATLLSQTRNFLVETSAEGRALERVASRPGNAGALSPAQLLALQCSMYRYAERIELTSRVVDKAAGALKTVLQTQV